MLRRGLSQLVRASCALFALAACSKMPLGAVDVQVFRASGPGCAYEPAIVSLSTLNDLSKLSGNVGSVVQTRERIDRDGTALDDFSNFRSLDLSFTEADGVFYPDDYASVVATNLYYAVELALQIHAQLTPASADLVKLFPGFGARTLIVFDADIYDASGEIYDNAEYIARYVGNEQAPRNLVTAYPTRDISGAPLGVNVGVMAHEASHAVFHHLFDLVRNRRGGTLDERGARSIGSLDEGVADYFGFLATKDPGFYLCSLNDPARNLAQQKAFDSGIQQRANNGGDDFDTHEGGAVYASIFYAAGRQFGHENVARGLHNMLRTLDSCAGTNPSLGDLARCHLQAAGTERSFLQTAYGSLP